MPRSASTASSWARRPAWPLAGAVVDEIGPPALFGGSAVLLPLLGSFFAGALKRRP